MNRQFPWIYPVKIIPSSAWVSSDLLSPRSIETMHKIRIPLATVITHPFGCTSGSIQASRILQTRACLILLKGEDQRCETRALEPDRIANNIWSVQLFKYFLRPLVVYISLNNIPAPHRLSFSAIQIADRRYSDGRAARSRLVLYKSVCTRGDLNERSLPPKQSKGQLSRYDPWRVENGRGTKKQGQTRGDWNAR